MNKIGFNVSGLENLSAPSIDIPNSSSDLMDTMVTKTNELTGGFFGLIVLTTLFMYLWWLLSDRSEYGDFRYSMVRSLGIASLICGIMGYFMLSFGYFTNFFHVAIFLGIGMITTIWVYIEENRR